MVILCCLNLSAAHLLLCFLRHAGLGRAVGLFSQAVQPA